MTARAGWSPWLVLGGGLFVLALLLSWFTTPVRPVWDALDVRVFFALNGTLESGDIWRWCWAAANTRLFDLVTALSFAAVYATFVFRGGWTHAATRVAGGIFLLAFTVFTLDVSSNYVYTFDRDSPSLVLEPAYRISDMIAAIKVKDTSGSSFPGDHGTAVLLFTIFIWFLCGRRYGLVAAAIAFVAVWPRMVGGAHWVTDLLVGSVSIAVMAGILALATPLAVWVIARIEWVLLHVLRWLHRRGWVPAAAVGSMDVHQVAASQGD